MTSKLMNVSITSIDANPWRNLSKYPFVESKVDALVRSIKDVGLWEGIIVRKVGNRYQLAFGHHRWKAAKKARLKKISVIVRDLTDEQMLQFMGRENLEDWNADFACMYEAWDAGHDLLFTRDPENVPKASEIATLLGWNKKNGEPNDTAQACYSAKKLLDADHLALDDIRGLTVSDVRELCQHTANRIAQTHKIKNVTEAQRKQAENQIARGMKRTLTQMTKTNKTTGRKEMKRQDIRSRVDLNTWSEAAKQKKRTPLFEQFGKNVCNKIEGFLNGDAASQNIEQMISIVDKVTQNEDARVIARLSLELEHLDKRVVDYGKQLTSKVRGKPAGKVINFERKQLAEAV